MRIAVCGMVEDAILGRNERMATSRWRYCLSGLFYLCWPDRPSFALSNGQLGMS